MSQSKQHFLKAVAIFSFKHISIAFQSLILNFEVDIFSTIVKKLMDTFILSGAEMFDLIRSIFVHRSEQNMDYIGHSDTVIP